MSALNQVSVHICPMTRQEFLGKEKKLTISYSIVKVPLGTFLVASTTKGVCFLMPADKKYNAVEELKQHFKYARFRCQKVKHHKIASYLLRQHYDKVSDFYLHLYGTEFQIATWIDLLNVSSGMVTTYLDIAKRIGKPRAARPVGHAVGKNPITYLIPCHRVICKDGSLGGYRWGVDKKIRFLNKETHVAQQSQGMTNWNPTFF